MHYFKYNIGDFDRETRHLTRVERSIYRDLLDLYYSTETQIVLDVTAVCRLVLARTDEERTAVDQVLNEFFTKTPTGWYQSRCEREIAEYRAYQSQKAIAGKASAAAKMAKKEQALNGSSTAVEQTNNGVSTKQKPENINHKTVEAKDSCAPPDGEAPPSGPQKSDPIPYQSIANLYNGVMSGLPKVRDMTPKRKTLIRSAWSASKARQDLRFWAAYFDVCAGEPFLNGAGPYREPHANWRPDFDYLLKSDVVTRVFERAMDAMERTV